MKIIGLTGGIASGKSTASRMFLNKKIPVIDGDLLARKVVEPGRPAYKLVVKKFSKDILNENGTLNRAKLGDIIFADETKRKILNQCTHPFIRREILKLMAWYWLIGEKMVLLDAPLLIESRLHKYMSVVIVVYCSEQLQLSRLLSREKTITESAARQRISAQLPLKEKIKYADFVIDNSGNISETEKQIENVVNKIKPSLLNWLVTWLGPSIALTTFLFTIFK
nr:14669_t:CDS:2 [Entrophospora candida]CAG8566695.1 2701_t:CDS:2 [Entrophospora candida]